MSDVSDDCLCAHPPLIVFSCVLCLSLLIATRVAVIPHFHSPGPIHPLAVISAHRHISCGNIMMSRAHYTSYDTHLSYRCCRCAWRVISHCSLLPALRSDCLWSALWQLDTQQQWHTINAHNMMMSKCLARVSRRQAYRLRQRNLECRVERREKRTEGGERSHSFEQVMQRLDIAEDRRRGEFECISDECRVRAHSLQHADAESA